MKTKHFMSLVEAAMSVIINEDHMKGKEVIVFGKRGMVVKEVGSDGDTENDEIYQVKFEDGSVKNVPARDMEMQSDKREPSENELEDIANESVEHLDEGLTLASDELNAVKKTAQKLAKQSPDLTYYVVKHNTRFLKGMKYAYYEVYQSVDMHLIKGKAKKVAGYGAKVDMRESVELDENGVEEAHKGSCKEAHPNTPHSVYNVPNAMEILKKFNLKGKVRDVPAINNDEWGTPGFTTEERNRERGDYVKGRRGNYKDQEYVVHNDNPDEPHMTVRVPREGGKDRLVRVPRSNFNKVSNGFKKRRFPGPKPR